MGELRAEMQRAFETYQGEVEGLRMYLLTVLEEPSRQELFDISNRNAAIAAAKAAYTQHKARYMSALMNQRSEAID